MRFRLTTFAVLLALVVGLKWKVKITVIVRTRQLILEFCFLLSEFNAVDN